MFKSDSRTNWETRNSVHGIFPDRLAPINVLLYLSYMASVYASILYV